MKRWRIGAITILVSSVVIGLFLFRFVPPANPPVVINQTAVSPVPTLNAERVAQGESLYTQHCAQCHGANLEGALNWKNRLADGSLPPPPHDDSGHTWHHPDSLLINIVTNGGDVGYNSKMPVFKDKLTENEIIAVLEFIKSKWSKDKREYQWWMTATRDTP